MNRKTVLTALLATVAGVAIAAVPFEELDTNVDGFLSEKEASVIEGLDFKKADADGDGQLTNTEYTAATSK